MDERMAYVGLCPGCERVMLMTIDAPEWRKEVAHDVADIILHGYVLKHVTAEESRTMLYSCKCKKAGDGQTTLFPTATPGE